VRERKQVRSLSCSTEERRRRTVSKPLREFGKPPSFFSSFSLESSNTEGGIASEVDGSLELS